MSSRLAVARHAARFGLDLVNAAYPARRTPPVPSHARWSAARARQWQSDVGWLVGCNFTPSTASNQLEMFQPGTYDPVTIDRELGWAAELGFTSIRLFLHHLLVEVPGFLDRLDEVLDIADAHGIGAMPVLFDGCWNPESALGPPPEPRPGVHNSRWLQSPGSAILRDRSRWDSLRPYVETVMGRFGEDRRVHAWDLFNEPNQVDVYFPSTGTPDKHHLAAGLLERVFDWAQVIDPDQPLTAGVFLGTSGATERAGAINRCMLSRSDVISFHSYQGRERLVAAIDHLERYERPLLCTEWLGRPTSTADLIDVLADRGVGAYCWGLVDGRTQTKFPWVSWIRTTPEHAPWFHELLHPDGTPYDPAEVERFERVCGPRRADRPGA